MRTREKGFSDYQFAPGEEKEIKAACRSRDPTIFCLLAQSCFQANPDIADSLMYSLLKGLSYDKLICISNIPLNRNDFYAYRRAALAIFRSKMEL